MSSEPSEEQKATYRSAFVRHCLILLLRGYARLKSSELQSAEEPHITGEIVRSVREALEAADAESWMQDFDILDDPPQNLPERFGKHRPRIDIEFVRVVRGRRPRFHIEAKRLYRSGSVNDYFGAEGLGMFVVGTYAADETSGGMLGYVQSEDSRAWLDRLKSGFRRRVEELRVCETFQSAPVCQDIAEVQISCHERASTLARIDIYHLLLEFL